MTALAVDTRQVLPLLHRSFHGSLGFYIAEALADLIPHTPLPQYLAHIAQAHDRVRRGLSSPTSEPWFVQRNSMPYNSRSLSFFHYLYPDPHPLSNIDPLCLSTAADYQQFHTEVCDIRRTPQGRIGPNQSLLLALLLNHCNTVDHFFVDDDPSSPFSQCHNCLQVQYSRCVQVIDPSTGGRLMGGSCVACALDNIDCSFSKPFACSNDPLHPG